MYIIFNWFGHVLILSNLDTQNGLIFGPKVAILQLLYQASLKSHESILYRMRTLKSYGIHVYLLAIYGIKINRDVFFIPLTLTILDMDGNLILRSNASPDLSAHCLQLFLSLGVGMHYFATRKCLRHCRLLREYYSCFYWNSICC